MEVKRSVRKAVEIGVMLAAVSALALAGCGGGGSGAAGKSTSINAYIAVLTDGVGLRGFSLAASPVEAVVLTATAGASGSYTTIQNWRVWNGSAWQTKTPVVSGYFLSSSGSWVDNTSNSTLTPNADGSITSHYGTETMVGVDLSDIKIQTGKNYNLIDPAISGGSAVINVGAIPIGSASATYPPGSITWISTKLIYAMDIYDVYDLETPIKTPVGNLMALNFADASSYTSSNPLCLRATALVYSATQPMSPNTARFDVYWTTCAAILGTETQYGTVDLTYKTARAQTVAEFSNYTGTLVGWFSQVSGSVVMPDFLAPINGSVWKGRKTPAGTNDDVLMANGNMKQTGLLNKNAMDSVMAAVGAPSF